MRRITYLVLAAVVTAALTACGGGGGSNGGGPAGDNRTVVADYHVGSVTTLTDTATETSIRIDAQALSSSGQVAAKFSESWSARPASPAVVPATMATLTTTCPWGSGDITLSHKPASGDTARLMWVWSVDGAVWRSTVTDISNGLARATLPAPSITYAVNRSGGLALRVGVVRRPESADASHMYLTRLTGNGPDRTIEASSRRTAIIAHGIMNGPESVRAAAEYLTNTEKLFDEVYCFVYPFCLPVEHSAIGLATVINALPEGKKVTLVGYSMGGLVASFALEQVNNVRWQNVDLLAMVGTPRQGTDIALCADLPRAFIDDKLNDPADFVGGWFDWDISVPSAKDMVPGSSLLSTLNNVPKNHGIKIPYVLIAGQHSDWAGGLGDILALRYYPLAICDGLVPSASLLGYSYSKVTRGPASQTLIPYNHGELIRSSGALRELANKIRLAQAGIGPRQTVTSDTGDFRATDTGWGWTFKAENRGSLPMVITERVMQTYDRNGNWVSDQWYDPDLSSGEFYPGSPHYWGQQLLAGQIHSAVTHTFFDHDKHTYAETTYGQHAYTIVVTDIGGAVSGPDTFAFSPACTVTLLDKDGSGPTPPTRAAIDEAVSRAIQHNTGRAPSQTIAPISGRKR